MATIQSPYNNYAREAGCALVETGSCGCVVPEPLLHVQPRFTIRGETLTYTQAERVLRGKTFVGK